jgi:hypothetical protein
MTKELSNLSGRKAPSFEDTRMIGKPVSRYDNQSKRWISLQRGKNTIPALDRVPASANEGPTPLEL